MVLGLIFGSPKVTSFYIFLQIWLFWKVCWSIIPLILTALFVISMVGMPSMPFVWEKPYYGGSKEKIEYPDWAHHIGWFLTLVTAVQIPVIAIFMIIYYGCKGKIRQVPSTQQ